MGHVPQDPVHSVGESSQFQGRERRRTSVGRHSSSRSSVAAARLARARWAEDLVAAWYRAHGYDIIARNWTMRGGELDVVARRGSLIVVCEVKARATTQFGAPIEAMTEQKVMRVRRAGHAFLREYLTTNPGQRFQLRFDVAAVLGTQLEVFENFF